MTQAPDATRCEHVPPNIPQPLAASCQGCGSRINLRLCATCGYVGCCESQLGHDRIHALDNGHPVIYAMPAGRGFIWCYEHEAYVS